MEPILSIRHLSLSLPVKKGMVSILHDVSLDVAPGQILGLVGESGSGKSMTAFAVTRLLPGGGREKLGGSIRFCGEELTEKSEKDMQAIRGRDISMIFQEPMTCLNPVFTIGRQMTDVLMTHQKISRSEAMKKAEDMLTSVHIRQAADVLRCYPYELSGGMRQRVMIGIALSCRPKLLIADEPTTALDVTVQAKILYLVREACRRLGTAVIFISHDLGRHFPDLRQCGGDVLRAHRGIGSRGRRIQPAGASLHESPHGSGAEIHRVRRRRGQALRHPGDRARSVRAHGGVPLRAALPLCDRDLPHPSAGGYRHRQRPSGILPQLGNGGLLRRQYVGKGG